MNDEEEEKFYNLWSIVIINLFITLLAMKFVLKSVICIEWWVVLSPIWVSTLISVFFHLIKWAISVIIEK